MDISSVLEIFLVGVEKEKMFLLVIVNHMSGPCGTLIDGFID